MDSDKNEVMKSIVFCYTIIGNPLFVRTSSKTYGITYEYKQQKNIYSDNNTVTMYRCPIFLSILHT